ncbi:UNVERIFIED_CONTAM: hypothetical protein RMT77_005070 [Armadillidium vulgare]
MADYRSELILQKEYKSILLFTPLFGEFSLWEIYFRKMLLGQCPESFCRLEADKSKLSDSDAVLFSASDLPLGFSEDFQEINLSQRKKDQLWIIFRMNHPSHIKNKENIIKMYKNFFNLTMSYDYSSDVISPFGQFITKKRLKDQNPFLVDVNGQVFDISSEEFLNRQKLLVVFLSDCDDEHKHQNFISELNIYLEFDVFHVKCSSKEGKFISMRDYFYGNYSALLNNTIGDYYFALTLEDALCSDYATEQFYVPLHYGAVPVVLAPSESPRIPRSSFVNVQDFGGLSDLTFYLKEVSRNKSLYLKYHEWRQDYSIRLSFPFEPDPCELCSKLHQRVEHKAYEDLSDWMSTEKCITDKL